MRRAIVLLSTTLLILALILVNSCTKDIGELDYTQTGFPQEVGKIIN